MRIKDKAQFALGVFNILLAITGIIIIIIQHRTGKLPLLVICFAWGIIVIINNIETKAQRQKRKAELQAMAKMYGWNKDGDTKKKIELTPHDLGTAFCNFNLHCFVPCAECAAYINGFCGGGEKPTPAELKKVGEEILKEWKGGDCEK